MLEPMLARLEVTIAAGTVSDRCNLFCMGGLLSNVADLCTEFLKSIGSSDSGGLLCVTDGAHCTIVSSSILFRAPSGSFSVTKVRGDGLKIRKLRYMSFINH